MSEFPSALDVSTLDLPSDQITMGQIRRSQPACFDTYAKSSTSSISTLNIAATIAAELTLARNAYAAAIGLPPTEPMDEAARRQYILELSDDYCQFGVSTGPSQTFELIRRLESAAADQAKHHWK